MKKIILLICFLISLNGFSQQVIDTMLVKVPYIGKEGGAHLLKWNLDEDYSKIYLYFSSNLRGTQLVASDSEIQSWKDKQKDKTLIGKIISGILKENIYENTILPVVLEKVVSMDMHKEISSKSKFFHLVENVPNNNYVFFRAGTGMVDLDFSSFGKKVYNHYKSIGDVFYYTPKYNQNVLSYLSIKLKGDGMLGIKNIEPKVVLSEANFIYNPEKGYITSVTETDVFDLKSSSELINYEMAKVQEKPYKEFLASWFINKDDESKYKISIFNETNKQNKIINFEFKAPREIKVSNMVVMDKNLNKKGYVTIFGYNKEGKKLKDIYPENSFDLVYFDLEGNIKKQIKFNCGDEDHYKRVVSPIAIFEDTENNLTFLNSHIYSIFKADYEVFTLDLTSSNLIVQHSEPYSKNSSSAVLYNYYDYLNDYNKIIKIGDFYAFEKIVSKDVDIPNSTATNDFNKIKEKKEVAVNYTVMDVNFKINKIFSLPIAENEKVNTEMQTIENTNNDYVNIIRKGRFYYMLKINANKDITSFQIKNPYQNLSNPLLYFGCFTDKFVLINEKDRTLYLLNEIYDFRLENSKIIDKIGLLKISY